MSKLWPLCASVQTSLGSAEQEVSNCDELPTLFFPARIRQRLGLLEFGSSVAQDPILRRGSLGSELKTFARTTRVCFRGPAREENWASLRSPYVLQFASLDYLQEEPTRYSARSEASPSEASSGSALISRRRASTGPSAQFPIRACCRFFRAAAGTSTRLPKSSGHPLLCSHQPFE